MKVWVTASRSYHNRFEPVDVPPGVAVTSPPRVSMSAQKAAMIGLLVEPVIELGVKLLVAALKVTLPLLLSQKPV